MAKTKNDEIYERGVRDGQTKGALIISFKTIHLKRMKMIRFMIRVINAEQVTNQIKLRVERASLFQVMMTQDPVQTVVIQVQAAAVAAVAKEQAVAVWGRLSHLYYLG